MKKAILKIMGLVAVAALMVLNIQFTNMEEGSMISLSSLKNLAFAQGGENDGGGGLDTSYIRNRYDCSITIKGKAGYSGTIWGISYTIPVEGEITITKSGQEIVCSGGGNDACTPRDC